MNNLVDLAIQFAIKAHRGQTRKYYGDPYIVHPARVAGYLQVYHPIANHQMVAAAWLHDVIEDCGVTKEELQHQFGDSVAYYVEELTHIEQPKVLRTERKREECNRLAKASFGAKVIKLCDRLDNIRDMWGCDKPSWARLYIAETKQLLEAIGTVHVGLSLAIEQSCFQLQTVLGLKQEKVGGGQDDK